MILKLSLLLTITLFSFSAILYANPQNRPTEAVAGKYNIYKDDYWILYRKTVEEIKDEGFTIPDKYSSDTELFVNYTRLNYSLKIKILSLSNSNINVENTEMKHDRQIKIYENNDGIPGDLIASFELEDVQENKWEWGSDDPHYGILLNPSLLKIGNKFDLEILEFTVVRKELLNTPLGEFNTYVLEGIQTLPYSIRWIIWCDSETGLIVKQSNNQEMMQRFISREETLIIETGNKIEVLTEHGNLEIPIETSSLVNEVTLDSDKNELNIMVEGKGGTKGELNVSIPKTIIPYEHEFTVSVDNKKTENILYEDSDNYYIYVDYNEEPHVVTISFMSPQEIPGFTNYSMTIGIVLIIIIATQVSRRIRGL